jgi:hypothetical protein
MWALKRGIKDFSLNLLSWAQEDCTGDGFREIDCNGRHTKSDCLLTLHSLQVRFLEQQNKVLDTSGPYSRSRAPKL